MNPLIECVPNFSEGRDLRVMDAIVEAMSGIPGAWILDRSTDPDHNRSVVTLAGEPAAVALAAIRGVGKAAELIDMTCQTGAHPRIGATDVLPFIPLRGISMEECVELAHEVGRKIWSKYRVPVYFYERAATRPDRKNLEQVRRGQFEGLRNAALNDPDRAPDTGGPGLHPTAGATAVGVRKLLIAYNVHLNTSDVSIAKSIARAIRTSGGGLPHVKAIGIDLKSRGTAQVSVNLTDFEATPLRAVFDWTKREAERHGCRITGSEIIGLVPRKALEENSVGNLQLENFSPDRILECRLAAAAAASIGPALAAWNTASSEEPKTVPAAAADAARSSLRTAIAALELFDEAVQLETGSAPSIPVSLQKAGREALAAAHNALDTIERKHPARSSPRVLS
jgi:glutamate formiminotransferase